MGFEKFNEINVPSEQIMQLFKNYLNEAIYCYMRGVKAVKKKKSAKLAPLWSCRRIITLSMLTAPGQGCSAGYTDWRKVWISIIRLD